MSRYSLMPQHMTALTEIAYRPRLGMDEQGFGSPMVELHGNITPTHLAMGRIRLPVTMRMDLLTLHLSTRVRCAPRHKARCSLTH